jgi:hypothetical protein
MLLRLRGFVLTAAALSVTDGRDPTEAVDWPDRQHTTDEPPAHRGAVPVEAQAPTTLLSDGSRDGSGTGCFRR